MEQLRKVAFFLPVGTRIFKSSILLPSSGVSFFFFKKNSCPHTSPDWEIHHSLCTNSRELALPPVQKDQVKLVPRQSHHTILILLLISQMPSSHFSIQLIFGQLLTSLHHRFTLSRNRFPLLSHQDSVALFTHLVPQTPYVKLYNLFC